MRAYILKDEDFDALFLRLKQGPEHGNGGSRVLSDAEKRAHEEAYRFFNYHVQTWAKSVGFPG